MSGVKFHIPHYNIFAKNAVFINKIKHVLGAPLSITIQFPIALDEP